MTEHAPYFQASAAHRWMSCPGSVKLCEGLPDESSAYAEEGTRAHEIAAAMLDGSATKREQDGALIWFDGSSSSYPKDMTENVMVYVDKVRELAGEHPVMIEQRVDFSEDIGQPDCFGTADCIILAGDEIQIHDLKYGMGVKVDAEWNPQLMLYALGALRAYEFIADFKRARLCIHQARLGHFSEWVVSVEDLREFAKAARFAAIEALSETPMFSPGEKQCRFCKAKAYCPSLAEKVADTIGQGFKNLDAEELKDDPKTMGDNTLSNAMHAVGLIEDWCKAIRARVERELLDGKTVDGFKLVQGRKGPRKWSDKAAAEAALKTMKLKVEEMYDFEVISPTTAEKLSKAGTIGPRQWPKLQQLITQSEGSISVAPASDPRPAMSPTATAADFETLTN